MKHEMFTINREQLGAFEGRLPRVVFENCKREGCFTIGAVDGENGLVGMAQFYIGMLGNKDPVSDLVYVYVDEKHRNRGAAGEMLGKIHTILKNSGIAKSLVFMEEKQEGRGLFTGNGYLFMKPETDLVAPLFEVHDGGLPQGTEQGVFWVDR